MLGLLDSKIMSKIKQKTKQGFTLIELMLAMTFVTTLVITVAILSNYVIFMYQKGLSLKSINSVGRHIIEDINRSVSASPAKTPELICRDKFYDGFSQSSVDKCVKDEGYKLTFHQYYGDVEINKNNKRIKVPLYGAFCTGRYSYIWNSGYFFNTKHYTVLDNVKTVQLDGYNDKKGQPKLFRLIRVPDSKRSVCASHVGEDYLYQQPNHNIDRHPVYTLRHNSNDEKFNRDINNQIKKSLNGAIELISETDESLAVYDMRIFRPAIHSTTNQALYSGTFILGTARGAVDITGIGEFCQENTTSFDTDFAYCAINKFNFAARSLGQMRSDEQLERNIYESKGL